MSKLKEVLVFANNKGGVGKTTTVHNVAAGLLRRNKKNRILCIDLDSQCSLSALLGWVDKRKLFANRQTVADALRNASSTHLPVYKSREGLFYCPASPMLSSIEPDLVRQMQPKMVLSKLLGKDLVYMDAAYPDADKTMKHDERIENIADDFDYVLIDCAPALSDLTYNALAAADGMIIPVQLGAMSVDGLAPMLEAYRNVKAELNPELELRGLAVVMVDGRTRLAKDTIDFLEEQYGSMMFSSRIRQCTKVGESQFQHADIFSYAPECTAAKDYENLVNEIIKTNK